MNQPALSERTTEFLAEMDWLEEQASRCRMLWIYVIRRAVRDHVGTRGRRNIRLQRLHQESGSWLWSNDLQHLNSFRSLCLITGTDPKYWRNEAEHQSPASIRRLELLGRRSSPK